VSTYDDETPLEFFEEPETVESPGRQRRRIRTPRGGGPRRPSPPPAGAVALARLAGLVALAIAVVVGLVFWVGSCQGKSKHDEYASYVDKVNALANGDKKLGEEFSGKLIAPGLKQSQLENLLQQYAQQEQQSYTQAQQIRPPGPLRAAHQNLVNAIELRAKGFAGLGDALARANVKKNATAVAEALTAEGEVLSAGDVVWEQLYRIPATQELQKVGVTGVAIPASKLIPNADLVSARSFGLLLTRLGGASAGGTVTGKHGDGLISVHVTPQGTDLSTSSPTTVTVSQDLTMTATVEDSGDSAETNVPVTLTITAGGKQIFKKTKTIPVIAASEQKTVSFTGFDVPPSAFASPATVTVFVSPVPGEQNLTNNKGVYSILFTLSQ
jgi:CARDB